MAVEFDAEIRFVVGHGVLQKFSNRAGSDAEFENDVVFRRLQFPQSFSGQSSGEDGVIAPTFAGFFKNA
jgi:hypothetical protein